MKKYIMTGTRKGYSKKLNDASDPASRKLIKEFFLKNFNVELSDNKIKQTDLVAPNGKLYELERRLPWVDYEFPYEKINFLERKHVHFSEKKFDYVIISRDYSRIGIISADKLKKYLIPENKVENPNKFVHENEFVYKLPKSKFKFYDVK